MTETFCYLPQSLQKNLGTAIHKTVCFMDKAILHSRSHYLAYNTNATSVLFTKLFQHTSHLSNKLTPLQFNTANIRACQQRWSWAITTHFTLPQFYFQNFTSMLSFHLFLFSEWVRQPSQLTKLKYVCEQPEHCTVISENSTYYDIPIKTEVSAGNHLPVNPVSHPRRHKSSLTTLW